MAKHQKLIFVCILFFGLWYYFAYSQFNVKDQTMRNLQSETETQFEKLQKSVEPFWKKLGLALVSSPEDVQEAKRDLFSTHDKAFFQQHGLDGRILGQT